MSSTRSDPGIAPSHDGGRSPDDPAGRRRWGFRDRRRAAAMGAAVLVVAAAFGLSQLGGEAPPRDPAHHPDEFLLAADIGCLDDDACLGAVAPVYGIDLGPRLAVLPDGMEPAEAVSRGLADVAVVSSEAEASAAGLVVLHDDRGLFSGDALVAVGTRTSLERGGAELQRAVDVVLAELDDATLRAMVAEVDGGAKPADVAAEWVRSVDLPPPPQRQVESDAGATSDGTSDGTSDETPDDSGAADGDEGVVDDAEGTAGADATDPGERDGAATDGSDEADGSADADADANADAETGSGSGEYADDDDPFGSAVRIGTTRSSRGAVLAAVTAQALRAQGFTEAKGAKPVTDADSLVQAVVAGDVTLGVEHLNPLLMSVTDTRRSILGDALAGTQLLRDRLDRRDVAVFGPGAALAGPVLATTPALAEGLRLEAWSDLAPYAVAANPLPAVEPLPTVDDVTADLFVGDTGPAVALVQQRLVQLGHDPGRTDGVFDESTRRAVVQFQRSQILPTSGAVGPLTRRRLEVPYGVEGERAEAAEAAGQANPMAGASEDPS